MCHEALDVEITRVDRLAVVTVQGEVDLQTRFTLSAALDEVSPDTFVWLDLENVHFMDSTGLNLLVTHVERFRQAGGTLVIVKASHVVRRAIELGNLTAMIQPTEPPLAMSQPEENPSPNV
jgi:stage II sporulation protein AA (anti-sigma F factor antagonist)